MSIRAELRTIRRDVKKHVQTYRLALKDPRTPRTAKYLLGLALGYLALPFDLIPDFIPVIGVMDDALIVPGLIYLALKQIPDEVLEDCRRQVKEG